MLITQAMAQTDGAGVEGIFGSFLIPMILIFGIMYFLMIRPQQKRQKQHKAKLDAATRNDKVITAGGIHGTIERVIDETTLLVKIADDVSVKVARATLLDVISKQSTASSSDEGAGKEKKEKKAKKARAKKSTAKKVEDTTEDTK